MLELKIQCDCGQKYKFDVEPLNGQMPFKVNCPVCGAEGTGSANQMLRGMATAGVTPIATAAVATAPVATLILPVPVSRAPRLRVDLASAEPVPEAGKARVEPPPPIAPPAPIVPLAKPGKPNAAATDSGKKPSFSLGLLGGLIGAVVGSLIYFLVFRYSGFRVKLLAIGVGYLAGLGAELLGRKEGSKELAVITATLALAGIVAAQYAVSRVWWNQSTHAIAKEFGYEGRVTEAKKVITAIPTGSDQEIRIYLAKQAADAGEKPDPKAITDQEIKEFREASLPEFRDLASGKLTKAEWEKQHAPELAIMSKVEGQSDEGTFKAMFLLLLLSRINIISMVVAAGTAFKLCANA
jgi:hypothetical protein